MVGFRALAAMILAPALPALAQPLVTVTVWHSSQGACDGGLEVIYQLDPGEDASINLSTCADRINIVTDPVATVDIGRLVFTGGPSGFPVDIVLGEGEINQSDVLVTPVGRDWEGMDATLLTETRFAGAINGSLTGPIFVHHMYRFDVLGEVRASIQVESPFPGGPLLLGSDAIAAEDPGPEAEAQWVWNGWASDVPIGSVVLAGNAEWQELLLQDDMQIRASSRTIPAPASSAVAAVGLLLWGVRARAARR